MHITPIDLITNSHIKVNSTQNKTSKKRCPSHLKLILHAIIMQECNNTVSFLMSSVKQIVIHENNSLTTKFRKLNFSLMKDTDIK